MLAAGKGGESLLSGHLVPMRNTYCLGKMTVWPSHALPVLSTLRGAHSVLRSCFTDKGTKAGRSAWHGAVRVVARQFSMARSILCPPGLHPLEVRSLQPHPTIPTTKYVSRYCQIYLGGNTTPSWGPLGYPAGQILPHGWFLWVWFYWHTAPRIHSPQGKGCLYMTTAESHSQSKKYLPSGLFQKNVVDLWLDLF